jgi:hypothetical protein
MHSPLCLGVNWDGLLCGEQGFVETMRQPFNAAVHAFPWV